MYLKISVGVKNKRRIVDLAEKLMKLLSAGWVAYQSGFKGGLCEFAVKRLQSSVEIANSTVQRKFEKQAFNRRVKWIEKLYVIGWLDLKSIRIYGWVLRAISKETVTFQRAAIKVKTIRIFNAVVHQECEETSPELSSKMNWKVICHRIVGLKMNPASIRDFLQTVRRETVAINKQRPIRRKS